MSDSPRAFVEEYPEEILALRALAGYVRTGEVELGYLDPISPASSLSSTLASALASALSSRTGSPVHDTPTMPSAPLPAAPHAATPVPPLFAGTHDVTPATPPSAATHATVPVPPSSVATHATAPDTPLSANSASVTMITTPTGSYPAPYMDPVMPTEEERRLMRSHRNGHWVWGAFVARRPGLYFTWCVLAYSFSMCV